MLTLFLTQHIYKQIFTLLRKWLYSNGERKKRERDEREIQRENGRKKVTPNMKKKSALIIFDPTCLRKCFTHLRKPTKKEERVLKNGEINSDR